MTIPDLQAQWREWLWAWDDYERRPKHLTPQVLLHVIGCARCQVRAILMYRPLSEMGMNHPPICPDLIKMHTR